MFRLNIVLIVIVLIVIVLIVRVLTIFNLMHSLTKKGEGLKSSFIAST